MHAEMRKKTEAGKVIMLNKSKIKLRNKEKFKTKNKAVLKSLMRKEKHLK